MKDITFVFASLNNGYDNNPQDPVPNYHFERTLFSVNSLRKLHNANIVFIDWCSEEQNKYLPRLTSGIKYVHVPKLINQTIQQDANSKQQFNEWIAKDVGSHFVETDKIAFVNGDNLFTEQFIEKISSLKFDNKQWYTATRLNIRNDIFVDLEKIHDKINSVPPEVDVLSVCNFCNGDFTLCRKLDYEQSGGYNYSHRHAYEDTNLTIAFQQLGFINTTLPDIYYHLDHKACGSSNVFSDVPINKSQLKQFILQNVEAVTIL